MIKQRLKFRVKISGWDGDINFDVVGCCVEVIFLPKIETMAYLIQLMLFIVENLRERTSYHEQASIKILSHNIRRGQR